MKRKPRTPPERSASTKPAVSTEAISPEISRALRGADEHRPQQLEEANPDDEARDAEHGDLILRGSGAKTCHGRQPLRAGGALSRRATAVPPSQRGLLAPLRHHPAPAPAS